MSFQIGQPTPEEEDPKPTKYQLHQQHQDKDILKSKHHKVSNKQRYKQSIARQPDRISKQDHPDHHNIEAGTLNLLSSYSRMQTISSSQTSPLQIEYLCRHAQNHLLAIQAKRQIQLHENGSRRQAPQPSAAAQKPRGHTHQQTEKHQSITQNTQS
ncbi:hypothetical protein Nepgr_007932 [Nepenthes gracilis]|uniref:Uncharacterized protein n=1 Tax=Nepenthes gracilis TaxID=150966 RepID=A0AAD3S8N4_NEPGR|nr:hypothetical protein Nepgr_007932 [Nepenthes gracilis]